MSDKLKVQNGSVEVRLRGRPVGRGVAAAPVQIIHGTERQFFRRTIAPSEIEAELERFRHSLAFSRHQLATLTESDSRTPHLKEIISTQQLMLEDPALHAEVEKSIREQRVNAEWATMSVVAAMSAKLRSLADQGLRERHADIEDVGERLLNALTGDAGPANDLAGDAVIVASELRPSTLAALSGSRVKAIVTEHGGWTSHTFILAREMGIPAVTGIHDLLRQARNGMTAVVDGFRGDVVLNPSRDTLTSIAMPVNGKTQVPGDPGSALTATLDGREIIFKANIDFPSFYARAAEMGVRGIGLFRSEFLLDRYKALPGEDEQFRAYREIADLAGGAGANIRTFDVGIRRFPEDIPYRERNAALGLRAIRLSLTRERDFRTQLRAIIRSAAGRNVTITLPMVSGVGEVRQAREILEGEKRRLADSGIEHGEPKLGAMVEVPSTIFIIEELVEESDFICLGTNDLVQYLLAVDRDNELVASWFNTLHPSIIRAVRRVVDACARGGKPLTVCGEMAGSPYYAPILVGLGATELSMNVNAIPRVRSVLGSISYSDARILADEVESSSTSEQAEGILHEYIRSKWPGVFPPMN
jgi:phosphotransferase system enzyme I (PtsI)